MKKSLIALAIAGVFAAPAAMAAETTIYGQANVSYDAISNGDNGGGNASKSAAHASGKNISSNVSRLGFKGSEDLGDGVSAIWQIERGINFTTTTAGDSVRDTFVGLSSGEYGTVLGGVHDTPYKMATRGFDLFADGIADNRSIMGGAALHDARLGNVVAYIAPAFSGLTLAIATSAGAGIPNASAGVVKGSAWSLAALYGGVPGLNLNFGYQTITIGTVGTGTLASGGGLTVPVSLVNGNAVPLKANDKTTAWKIGGSYVIDAFQVNAVYEKITYTPVGGSDLLDQANIYLGGKYNLDANDAVKVAYTHAGQQTSTLAGVYGTTADKTSASQVSLGLDHGLSKHTTVYALWSKINNHAGSAYTFSQASDAANANGGSGSDASVVSLGVKHSF